MYGLLLRLGVLVAACVVARCADSEMLSQVQNDAGSNPNDAGSQDAGNINHPPKFNTPSPQRVKNGQKLSFVVSAEDVDGDRIELGIADPPQGSTFQMTESRAGFAKGLFTWAPDPCGRDLGFYVAHFTASDGQGGADQKEVKINVIPLIPPQGGILTLDQDTTFCPGIYHGLQLVMGASNITVIGTGVTLDGGGDPAIKLSHVNNVRIEGFTFQNHLIGLDFDFSSNNTIQQITARGGGHIRLHSWQSGQSDNNSFIGLMLTLNVDLVFLSNLNNGLTIRDSTFIGIPDAPRNDFNFPGVVIIGGANHLIENNTTVPTLIEQIQLVNRIVL